MRKSFLWSFCLIRDERMLPYSSRLDENCPPRDLLELLNMRKVLVVSVQIHTPALVMEVESIYCSWKKHPEFECQILFAVDLIWPCIELREVFIVSIWVHRGFHCINWS